MWWRGLLGAIGGAIRRGFQAGFRLITQGLRLGLPPPKTEFEEAIKTVKDIVRRLPPEDAQRFIEEITQEEILREAQPYPRIPWETAIIDPRRIPAGPRRYPGGMSAGVFRFRLVHPILEEVFEQEITVLFDSPKTFSSLYEEAISSLVQSPLAGRRPAHIELLEVYFEASR